MRYDVTVVGGGLAGCSAARQLAQRDYDVLLLEKDSYPRHKLCGEFLSPEAQSSLRTLGVLEAVREAGAHPVRRAQLTGPRGTAAAPSLPGTALGLSRYRLDALLFRRACAAGVDGRPDTTVTAVDGSLDDGFSIRAGSDTFSSRVAIGAYGRRGILDRTLDRPFLQRQSPFVAFKAHYRGPPASVPGTIEVHAAAGGYCGIGPVEENRLNVCWIGNTEVLKEQGGSPEAMLNRALRSNPALDERMAGLTRISEGFEAVSQVPLMPKDQFVDDVCMIGDAAGMIAPLCGDGMAMALDTADLVAPLVAGFLEEQISASRFRSTYRTRWRSRYGRRLRLGRWVHWAAFRPAATATLLGLCRFFPPVARWFIRSTRG